MLTITRTLLWVGAFALTLLAWGCDALATITAAVARRLYRAGRATVEYSYGLTGFWQRMLGLYYSTIADLVVLGILVAAIYFLLLVTGPGWGK